MVPTALGFATWSYALSRTTAGRTGAWLYLVPVVAVALGWLVLGEAPSGLAMAGGALCLAGVYLAPALDPLLFQALRGLPKNYPKS